MIITGSLRGLGRNLPWRFAVIASVIASATLVLSIPPGTSYTDTLTAYHLYPVQYLKELGQAWSDKLYLGLDTGAMQLVLFPDAVFYAILNLVGLNAAASQRVVLFSLFCTSGVSVSWFASIAQRYLTKTQPILFVAPIFYILNLYVGYTIAGNSPMLWPYATLPAIAALTCLGVRARDPIRMGVLAGFASIFLAGSNPAVLLINCFALVMFIFYLVRSDSDKRNAAVVACKFAVVAVGLGVLCNAFWIMPFVHYARTVWVAGVFSESVAWHSSQANIPDILRLIGGEGFFSRSEQYGWAYPYQYYYRDRGLVDLVSRIVPVVAFSTLLWRSARRELFLRFLTIGIIIVAFLASGSHGGPDGGAWTAALFKYVTEKVTAFQIFRELEKWDSLIALAVALLCAYHAGLLKEYLGGLAIKLNWMAGLAVAALGVVAGFPLLLMGPFRPQSMLSSLPAYWLSAAQAFGIDRDHRTALFPKQYLPHFFWGEVPADFGGVALQAPTAYSIASGSGSPSPATAFYLESMYRGVANGSAWSAPLFARLGIAKVLEERDSFYTAEERDKAPDLIAGELAGLPGLTRMGLHGDLSGYRVLNTTSLIGVARPFIVGMNGPDLLNLFTLLRNDEVTVSDLAESRLSGDMPGIYPAGDLPSLAATETTAVSSFHMDGRSAFFWTEQPRNIRVFARTGWFVPWGSRGNLLIDGIPGTAEHIGDAWVQVAAFRARAGRHIVSIGSQSISGLEIKIVDANQYQVVFDRLASSRNLGQLIPITSQGQKIQLPATDRYTVRVAENSNNDASYSLPLVFASGAIARTRGTWCGNVPVIQDAGVSENNEPPRNWYYEPENLPLTRAGRITSTWFESSDPITIFNPFRATTNITVRGIFAAVGRARTIDLVNDNDIATGEHAVLRVPDDLSLRRVPTESLAKPIYTSLAGSASAVSFSQRVQPGWSRISLVTDSTDGLPNIISSLGGFITFGNIGSISASGCGALNTAFDKNDTPKRINVRGDVTGKGFAVATIQIPKVPLGSVPSLAILGNTSGTLSLAGIAHYVASRGHRGSYPISFTEVSPGRFVSFLNQGSDLAPAHSRILSVDLAATLSGARSANLEYPELTLAHAPMEIVGSVKSHGQLSTGISVLPDRFAGQAQNGRLVLSLYNPDIAAHGVSFDDVKSNYIGRSVQLSDASVVRLSDRYARVMFPVPPVVPERERSAWRGQIRLFVGNKQLTPTVWAAETPYQFGINNSQISAVVPISLTTGAQAWHLIYIPGSWFAESRDKNDTFEIRIPIANGRTNIEGELAALWPALTLRQTNRDQKSQIVAPVSLDDMFVESPSFNEKPLAVIVKIDGHPVPLTRFSDGWNAHGITLAAGYHQIQTNGSPLEGLLLPDAIAESATAPVQNATVSRATSTVNLTVRNNNAPLTVVWRQEFNSGWRATSGGRSLDHVIVDGFANGFLLNSTGGSNIHVFYEPRRLLFASRIVSVASALLACILLCWLNLRVPSKSLRSLLAAGRDADA